MTIEDIERMDALLASGYAGVMPDGKIVDRREYPTATPVQENELLGVPEPKSVPNPHSTSPGR